MKAEAKKRNVTIKLYPETITRIEEATKLGYKKNFIIEDGIRMKLVAIEREKQILIKAGV